ncbi:MAG: DUF2782 domain-containing protein [Gammaproteobacteria bacterium]|nr:DUF2782 domain-containing protein [Gammaproteobacteria bacterium]
MKMLLLFVLFCFSSPLFPASAEADIVIRSGSKETIEEYRLNNQLYMLKITPNIGPAYFLIDRDGDGDLETKRFELDENFQVPQWVLIRW